MSRWKRARDGSGGRSRGAQGGGRGALPDERQDDRQGRRDLDLTETVVRRWVAQAEVDGGQREGLTTAEREELAAAAQGEPGPARGARHPQASDGFLREGDPVNVYPFIAAEKAAARNVRRACALLEVSRSAYYQWSQHVPSRARAQDDELLERIESTHPRASRVAPTGRRGSMRSCASEGVRVGRKRVARLMAQRGLAGAAGGASSGPPSPTRRGPGGPTWCSATSTPAALASTTPGLGDITYVRTWEGWLYLATVIDLASRRVVGFAMADHMRTSLVSDALRMALAQRRPAPGLDLPLRPRQPVHLGATSASCSRDTRSRQSLSRPRQCWDNAVAESFFATLKTSSSTASLADPGRGPHARSSSSSRSSTIASACTPPSATSPPPSTKQRWRIWRFQAA